MNLTVTQNVNQFNLMVSQEGYSIEIHPVVNTVSPDYIESDPIFQASEASLFVEGDKSNLDNQSGINSGDETTLSIQTKRPLKTINGESLEGNGNVQIDYNDLDNIPTLVNNHSELNLDDGSNPHGTTKSDVGLSNVDNTSDVDKPISTATQNSLDSKLDKDISIYTAATTPLSGTEKALIHDGTDFKEVAVSEFIYTTDGKSYESLSSAMAVIPLPENNTIFYIDESNLTERGLYAYDSNEVSGYRFVRNYTPNGIVEESNTNAVSGGEVYRRIVLGDMTEVYNDWMPGYFRTNGSEVSPPSNVYGMEKTPKILLQQGQKIVYGVNTYMLDVPAILISFNLDGSFKGNLVPTNDKINSYYESEYTATEDILVSLCNNTALNLGVKYIEIQYESDLSLTKINERINGINLSELTNKVNLIDVGGNVDVLRQYKDFSLNSFYYYHSPGGVSPTAYGFKRTAKFLLKKGEKLKYGVNTYTITGSASLLNLYSLEGTFLSNILKTTASTISQFIEGEYIATQDVLVGMSDYTNGAYGTAYAYIEEYTYHKKGLTEVVEAVEDLESKVQILNPSDFESQNIYQRGLAKQNLSTLKKYGIIVAGQSNTEGRVPISQAPSYITSNNNTVPNVLMWNGGTKAFAPFKFGTNTGSGTGTTTSTLYAYDAIASYLLAQNKAQTIYLIKTARGGTAIDVTGSDGGGYWTPYTEIIPSGKLKLIEDLKLKVLTALKDNPDLEIKAILWHQGEGDSATATARVKYYQNFKNVIAYIRGIVGNPKLPFVFGTISPLSAQFSIEVDTAFTDVFNEDDFVYKVDMSDGTLLDAWHFDATSTNNLGERMFNILKDF